jgi:hypothetical protein
MVAPKERRERSFTRRLRMALTETARPRERTTRSASGRRALLLAAVACPILLSAGVAAVGVASAVQPLALSLGPFTLLLGVEHYPSAPPLFCFPAGSDGSPLEGFRADTYGSWIVRREQGSWLAEGGVNELTFRKAERAYRAAWFRRQSATGSTVTGGGEGVSAHALPSNE